MIQILFLNFLLLSCTFSDPIDFGWDQFKPKSIIIEKDNITYFSYTIDEKLKLETRNKLIQEEIKYLRAKLQKVELDTELLADKLSHAYMENLKIRDQILEIYIESNKELKEIALKNSAKKTRFLDGVFKSLTDIPTLLLLGVTLSK